MRILVIPDTQAHPGFCSAPYSWAARAAVDLKPDVIVHLGDHADMPSLSQWDEKGSKETEGRRVLEDIKAANDAWRLLNDPIQTEIKRRLRLKRRVWRPRLVYLLGNHEDRITRAVSRDPRLDGLLSLDMIETPGWERVPFLQPIEIGGILFSHYFAGTFTGKPIGGSIQNRIAKIGRSHVAGHVQGFDYGCQQLACGETRHSLIVGSYYLHDEPYRKGTANSHWRGLCLLNEVRNGDFDLCKLSLDYIRRTYGGSDDPASERFTGVGTVPGHALDEAAA